MSKLIKDITADELLKLIAESDKLILVDFYANWCGPCKLQSPIVDELAEELDDKLLIVKANTDNCYDACVKYMVVSIPTLMLFKAGEPVEKSVGLTSKEEITAMVIRHL